MPQNVLTRLVESGRGCIGCFACEAVCEHGSVLMVLDDQGCCRATIRPETCISCGRCSDACPQLACAPAGEESPDCFAIRAGTAGVVSALFDWMASRGGSVCVPVFDEGMHPVYALVEDKSVLDRMADPRYVPSEMRGIYSAIKEKVEGGKDVLFMGPPCHVAAVRNHLGGDGHLYAADFVCKGRPTGRICRDRLSELSGQGDLKGLSFNPEGSSYGSSIALYADGTRKATACDGYVRACSESLIVDGACYGCGFAGVPRHGDISIGDLQGAVRILNDVDDGERLCAVLCNTPKGEEMVAAIRSAAGYFRPIPLDFIAENGGLGLSGPVNPYRDRFFGMVGRGRTVSESAGYCL